MRFLYTLLDIFRPDQVVNDLWDIDFRDLIKKGITYFIVDLDGTLANKGSYEIDPRAIQALDTTLNPNKIKGVCILSNLVYSSKKREIRLIKISKQLGADRVAAYWPNTKPEPGPYEQAMELMGSSYLNTAVIGDQLLTDIKGGNSLGLHTILVKALPGSDHPITISKRLIEKWLLKKLGINFPKKP